jgi:hypothetical protein
MPYWLSKSRSVGGHFEGRNKFFKSKNQYQNSMKEKKIRINVYVSSGQCSFLIIWTPQISNSADAKSENL